MGYESDDDGVIRNLPDPTPGNMEAKRRKYRDEARFSHDKGLTSKQKDRLHEAHYEHGKKMETWGQAKK